MGAERAGSPERLPREPRPRRIDDDDVRAARLLAKLLDRLADVPGEELRVLDAVELGVLDRAGDGFLGDLEPPDGARFRRERETDRARAAVEVEHVLVTRERRVLAGELVEPRRHLRVRLEERGRADAEAQPEDLLLDRVRAPEELRREVRLLRRRVVDRPVDRAHLREPPEDVHEIARLEALAGRGDEHHERLAGVAPLAHDEMAEVPGPGRLVVGLELLLARPVANGKPDRVAEVGGQQALLDPDHLVPPPGAMEAEIDPSSPGVNEYSSLLR